MVLNRDVFTQWNTTQHRKMKTHVITRIKIKAKKKDLRLYDFICGKLKNIQTTPTVTDFRITFSPRGRVADTEVIFQGVGNLCNWFGWLIAHSGETSLSCIFKICAFTE